MAKGRKENYNADWTPQKPVFVSVPAHEAFGKLAKSLRTTNKKLAGALVTWLATQPQDVQEAIMKAGGAVGFDGASDLEVRIVAKTTVRLSNPFKETADAIIEERKGRKTHDIPDVLTENTDAPPKYRLTGKKGARADGEIEDLEET